MSRVDLSLVFDNISDLEYHIDNLFEEPKIIMASGGFDPMHIGHLKYLQEAARIDEDAILVVVVNSDDWLMRKKGHVFMSFEERAAIVAGVSGVDCVVGWDDGGPTVTGAIKLIRPDVFAKGGDRNSVEKIPEYSVCQSMGCEVLMNVGGGKIQSSSELIDRYIDNKK